MNEPVERVLLSEEELKFRVAEIGAQITADYEGKDVVIVGVLKGSVIFLADLVREIKIPITIDFISCSSYGNSSESSGVVRILKDLDRSVEGKHVVVVEDIVDTGTTLNYLLENLRSRNAASVKLVALLNKPERRKVQVHVDYNGFNIPDHFVIGYGLDYAEQFRHLPYIGVLKESYYKNK